MVVGLGLPSSSITLAVLRTFAEVKNNIFINYKMAKKELLS